MRGILSLLAFWLWASAITALPYLDGIVKDSQLDSQEDLDRRALSNGLALKILPVGASIVYGANSPDGNGFRYALRNQLVTNGNPVDMVGSVNAGTMDDNQVEGWPGFVINQMYDKAALDISSKANLILLHVGTNDMLQNNDYMNAHLRLGSLIDWMFSNFPSVTIIASTLLPNGNTDAQSRVSYYNSKIPGMVAERQQAGKRITYVDFSSSFYSLSDIGPDGTHPTANGYLKMAKTWYDGIVFASNAGLL